MMDLNITKDEQNALKKYINEKYETINQMLVSNCEADLALLSEEVESKKVELFYNKDDIIENIELFKLIYSLILKYYYKTNPSKRDFYRGTNLAEVERMKAEVYIDRMLSATEGKTDANNNSNKWNKPVRINLNLENNVPYIYISDIIKRYKNKEEILISPFTIIKNFNEENEDIDSIKTKKIFSITLEKQNLDILTEKQRNGLYSYIIDNSSLINKKLDECIKLEKENTINYDNIRKLEQLLDKYENSIEEKELGNNYSDIDREIDIDDVKRINKELDELKKISSNIFEMKKDNINFVNIWKRNIAVYLIAECKEIERYFEEDKEDAEDEEDNETNLESKQTKSKKDKGKNTNKKEKENSKKSKKDSKSEDIIENTDIVENSNSFENDDIVDNSDIFENADTNVTDTNIDSKINNNENELFVSEQITEEKNKNGEDGKVRKKVVVETNESSESVLGENFEKTLRENEKRINDLLKEKDDTIVFREINTSSDNMLISRVRLESKDNIDACKKLIEDINYLISRQQNHARIAGNMGATYCALNNAFEMRNVAERLLSLVEEINLKIEALAERTGTAEIEEKLEKISGVSIQISTLINYLNNPKIVAENNTNLSRFDELCIIEENELKRRITEEIRNICGEAELKKLKDDLEIIEDKSTFSRIIGFITGRNKLDEFMIEQIELRQMYIRKTLSKKLSLAYNYSIHEQIAKIKMFIEENYDDELVEKEVSNLKHLATELKNNYVINDSKVQNIIHEKDGRNMPYDKRMSKKEMIEVETYRFLNKYGYNNMFMSQNDTVEYQDTMANEISRIVEYINSSNIL